jgi:hypothetical protein
LVDVAQLTAISAGQTTGRLDQLLRVLASIDQRLAVSNDQLRRIVETSVNTQASSRKQGRKTGKFLRETINSRFDAVSKEALANDLFRKELAKLRKDILEDVEKVK